MGKDPYTGQRLDYKTAPITKEETARNREVMRQVMTLVDPTGVSTWPDVEQSYELVLKEPTYANSGDFILQLAGTLPLIGNLGRAASKVGGLIGVADKLSDSVKAHKALDAGKAADLNTEISKAKKQLETLDQGADTTAAASKVLKTILGFKPRTGKDGKLIGTWVDDQDRVFVTLETPGMGQDLGDGRTVSTFYYSSGTSYLSVDSAGDLSSSPRSWLPAKNYGRDYPEGNEYYRKPRPGEAGFGSGRPDVWNSLVEPKGKYGEQWWNYISDRHGDDWPRKIRYPGDKDFEKYKDVFNDLDKALQAGALGRVPARKPKDLGKYPELGSAYDKIGKELLKLSPDGKATKSLTDVFGEVRTGTTSDYNKWREGLL